MITIETHPIITGLFVLAMFVMLGIVLWTVFGDFVRSIMSRKR